MDTPHATDKKKTPQEMQDEMFRAMTAEEKVRLASSFSSFIISLHAAEKSERLSRTARGYRESTQ